MRGRRTGRVGTGLASTVLASTGLASTVLVGLALTACQPDPGAAEGAGETGGERVEDRAAAPASAENEGPSGLPLASAASPEPAPESDGVAATGDVGSDPEPPPVTPPRADRPGAEPGLLVAPVQRTALADVTLPCRATQGRRVAATTHPVPARCPALAADGIDPLAVSTGVRVANDPGTFASDTGCAEPTLDWSRDRLVAVTFIRNSSSAVALDAVVTDGRSDVVRLRDTTRCQGIAQRSHLASVLVSIPDSGRPVRVERCTERRRCGAVP